MALMKAPGFSDEFTGLSLRMDGILRPNQFTIEEIGLFAIAALKEEALLEYTDPLIDYTFTDDFHPGPRLRISLEAETEYLLHVKVVRSTVMWAIAGVAVDMMRRRCLHPLTFRVFDFGNHIYSGSVELRPAATLPEVSVNGTSLARRTLSAPVSMEVLPIGSSHRVLLKSTSNIEDQPRYDLSFYLVPGRASVIDAVHVFRALMALLLDLAKVDAAGTLERLAMTRRDLQAWVFMLGRRSLAANQPFQQFQAVAIAEAIARYFQLHREYREMTFALHADGQLLASGCVTKSISARQWCRGLDSRGGFAFPGSVDRDTTIG
ncbi:MAG: hypothetical protein Q9169_006380 [Polycauliona sp. 2 TL-2023]